MEFIVYFVESLLFVPWAEKFPSFVTMFKASIMRKNPLASMLLNERSRFFNVFGLVGWARKLWIN